MTTHLSARLAWHMDGWEGRPCQDPATNCYCVGPHSYPGEMIKEQRQLTPDSGGRLRCRSARVEDGTPPCIYSMNAFGTRELRAYSTPPDFFNDDTETRYWALPPATVCVWPYEVMYGEDVRVGERSYDYATRLKNAQDYFAQFTVDKSLIFYYANYSNPFSQDEDQKYVAVGVSRLKAVGDILYYQGISDRVRERYAGGFVWQMNLTSHYPEQGMRIPYHLYRDQPDVLQRISLVPDNPRNFKFATREVADDDALGLVERLIDVARYLKDIGDTSEDWSLRLEWLESLVTELWRSRGLYPGLPAVLELLKYVEGIRYFKQSVEAGREHEAKDALFAVIEGKVDSLPGQTADGELLARVRRAWRLRNHDEQHLLKDVLPRLDLAPTQVELVLSDDSETACCVAARAAEITANPYVLCEQYVGTGPDDTIPFGKIDRGVLPSPQLGGPAMAEPDDPRRLRALCVDRLKRVTTHAFEPASSVIEDVNRRLAVLADWRKATFNERYLRADQDFLSQALTLRESEGQLYLYLKSVYEDEREIEQQLRSLAARSDIRLRSPVTDLNWREWLYQSGSKLAERQPDEYERAISGQVSVCHRIFLRPVAVLGGAAGTGKTTAIKALISAIERAHGTGTSFQILAPTGKAADRIRSITGKAASTIHSFLAAHNWLNENMTFRRSGGQQVENINTYIIDEASMVDLELMAALFRSINWNTVQRLVLVGDPNQLPPIGRGRVFADVIEWLQDTNPEGVGLLQSNIRQMENRLAGRGTAMLELASLYVRNRNGKGDDSAETQPAEVMLGRVQVGGDIDNDLRVIYWSGADDLHAKLASLMVADMEKDTETTLDPERPYELWRKALSDDQGTGAAEKSQVISPYRGEFFGTDGLNELLQSHAQKRMLEKVGSLGGITLFDKVIQYRNRGKSDPLSAFNLRSRVVEPVEVYNGEIGLVKPHGFDGSSWQGRHFWFRRFQVVFSRKLQYWVNYGSELGNWPQGKPIKSERVEDNLELAYAISVHKAQGSEFERVYFVVPKHKRALLSRELFYTGLTRATRHCTLLVEEDISPLLSMYRPEASHLMGINSSIFGFRPVPAEWLQRSEWYQEGKIHRTLASQMVRSKSEVIIANILLDRQIPFDYEVPLYAPDGTFYLPDFTLVWSGEKWYWEHLGMLHNSEYRRHWEAKRAWYGKHGFADRLIVTTEEEGFDSAEVIRTLEKTLR